MTAQLERQIKVSRMLSLGFVFTIWPVWAATSGIAIIIGVIVMGIINESAEPMAGRILAWWCIIVLGLEVLLTFLILVGASFKGLLCAQFQL